MKHVNLQSAFFSLLLALLFLGACTKDPIEPQPEPTPDPEEPIEPEPGKYSNGFFLVHEGWMGHGTGSVSFYDYETETLIDSVFQKENPDKDFEPSNSTLQYGTIFDGKLYIVSKVNGPVVVADATTLKETGRIPSRQGYDWRAFVGLDENTGLLSSGDGVHIVNLKSMGLSGKLYGVNGQVGDMLRTDKFIFVQSQSGGSVVYYIEDLSVARKIPAVSTGFAETPNGKVWYTSNEYLISLDGESLEADTVELPYKSNSTWFAWYSSPIIASSTEDAVYMQNAPMFGGGKEVYKYIDGDESSLSVPFITMPDKQSFYKKNIGYDANLDQIVATTVQDGYGANYAVNTLYFYDAKTGDLVKSMPFNKKLDETGNDVSYFFTSMFVFHEED
ncbi:DUF5074 domain-containing protein [Albibacterium profundi]|uniref:DUF5074 domain-containing protein n=1 Tax=Albibacterium profundi TaxID=3134906 RepID=A0ABV5C9H0_9SPHI